MLPGPAEFCSHRNGEISCLPLTLVEQQKGTFLNSWSQRLPMKALNVGAAFRKACPVEVAKGYLTSGPSLFRIVGTEGSLEDKNANDVELENWKETTTQKVTKVIHCNRWVY